MTTLKVTVDPIMRPVRAFYATDSSETHVEGICIATLPSPSLIIRTPDGRDVAWLADLCEVTGEEVSDLPPTPSLVVIDPESDADVARLENALEAKGCRVWAGVRAALREFANPTPPKPEEPTGLGAVVEDASERPYTRITSADLKHPWVDEGGCSYCWSEFAAVRVLSEGVQA